jgi:hypothetical protein
MWLAWSAAALLFRRCCGHLRLHTVRVVGRQQRLTRPSLPMAAPLHCSSSWWPFAIGGAGRHAVEAGRRRQLTWPAWSMAAPLFVGAALVVLSWVRTLRVIEYADLSNSNSDDSFWNVPLIHGNFDTMTIEFNQNNYIENDETRCTTTQLRVTRNTGAFLKLSPVTPLYIK